MRARVAPGDLGLQLPRLAAQPPCRAVASPLPASAQSSPQCPALIPEAVEPIVAGLGALSGDGQQVGRAAPGPDAACKAQPAAWSAHPRAGSTGQEMGTELRALEGTPGPGTHCSPASSGG